MDCYKSGKLKSCLRRYWQGKVGIWTLIKIIYLMEHMKKREIHERKRTFTRSRRKWENDIKVDIEEIEWQVSEVGWSDLVYSDNCWVLLNVVIMNIPRP
jgi:hypothetical protein